jgi:hypothetical protein
LRSLINGFGDPRDFGKVGTFQSCASAVAVHLIIRKRGSKVAVKPAISAVSPSAEKTTGDES